MNINHLAIFFAVAEEGSVTRAADRLYISQPAVSKQLRELEKSLGMALFHRLSTGVRLTDAGELLHGYARSIFALETEAEQALSELRHLERGHLIVGASTTIGAYLLPEVCAAFREQCPGVEMSLIVDNSAAIERRLTAHEINLALVEGPLPADALQTDILMPDEIVPIAGTEHAISRHQRVTAAEFLAAGLIVREVGSGTRAIIEAELRRRELEFQPTMSLGNTEAIKRSVAAGAGVALVSSLAIQSELSAGMLRRPHLEDLSIQRSFHRLRLHGQYENRASREFLRLFRASIITRDAFLATSAAK